MLNLSVEHEKVPEKSGNVRAIIHHSVYLKAIDENTTKVVSFFNTDPCGSLPTALFNQMTGKQFTKYIAIKKLLES